MLIEVIDQWALTCPERVAHHYREQSLTYSDLKTNSDALALWLHEALEGDKVYSVNKAPIVVYGHKESEMLVAFLACAKAGHAYIPVDTSVPLERVRQILEASGTSLLLSPQSVPEELKLAGVTIQENFKVQRNPKVESNAQSVDSFDILTPYLGQTPNSEWSVSKDGVYYIIFTSGSTGTPKGVQITLKALESFLNWMNPTYGPEKMKEVFLNQAPFSFDLSVMDLYMSLSTGGTLWSIDKKEMANARELFQSFARSNVSFWVSTPSFAEICLMDKSFNRELLPKLKRFLFCGEVLTHDTASKLRERFPSALVENLYGPTEATVAVTTLTITSEVLERYNPLPVGRVKRDAQILICDTDALNEALAQSEQRARGHNGQIQTSVAEGPINNAEGQEGLRRLQSPPQSLPEGTRGEVVIAGPNVSVGYLNRPEQTQKSFFTWCDDQGKEWQAYRTGDAGILEEGMLFFFGRLDFQVKLHGYRIELGDIEENLRKVPGVENAVVLPSERRGKVDYLHAFITTSEPVKESFQMSQHLREELHKTLPDYMLPRRFTFLETMPMTPNGKVDRRALGGGAR